MRIRLLAFVAVSIAAFAALPTLAQPQGPMGRQREKVRQRAEVEQEKAQQAVVSATTFFGLARAIGSVPDKCQPLGAEKRICSWAVYKRMSGYSWLAGMTEPG